MKEKMHRAWWGLLALLARWGIALPGKVMYIGGSDTLPPPLKREKQLYHQMNNSLSFSLRIASMK